MLAFSQTGELLEAVAAVGVGFTITFAVLVLVEVHPPTVICRE